MWASLHLPTVPLVPVQREEAVKSALDEFKLQGYDVNGVVTSMTTESLGRWGGEREKGGGATGGVP